MIDDTLVLGFKKGKRKSAKEAALSVSALKEFSEDPHRWYLKKIAGLKEPDRAATFFGSGMHAAMQAFASARENRSALAIEAFRSHIASGWDKLDDKTERFNPQTPWFADRKQPFEITVEQAIERGERLLAGTLPIFEAGWEAFSIYQVLRQHTDRVETRLGDLAKERGMPYATMGLFDPQQMKYDAHTNVAVVAGVPFQGYVDYAGPWLDGSPFILDFKAVGHIVAYYQDGRTYGPSYNPATDFQLDLYALATGITRAGFFFWSKNPQYVPETGQLYPQWVDERYWKLMPQPGFTLPMAWAADPQGEVRHAAVWRPAPEDHPTRPSIYTPEQVRPRAEQQIRAVAEAMTESIILYESGVDPALAFPAGDPKEIARKSCPFCPFQNEGCKTPRHTRSAQLEYERAIAVREQLANENPEIQELRKLWAARQTTC